MKTDEEKYQDYIKFRKQHPEYFESSRNRDRVARLKRVEKRVQLKIEFLEKIEKLHNELKRKLKKLLK